MFLLFALPTDVKCPDGHSAPSWHTAQSCRSIELSVYTRNYRHLRTFSLNEKLSTPQNLPYLKQSLGEIPGEDCRLLSTIRFEWWNRVTGLAVGLLFQKVTCYFFGFKFCFRKDRTSLRWIGRRLGLVGSGEGEGGIWVWKGMWGWGWKGRCQDLATAHAE